MSPDLIAGSQLSAHYSRLPVTVGRFLGRGRQGEVYEVVFDTKPHALKWFHREYIRVDTGLRARIENLIYLGPPSPVFLWPADMVGSANGKGFGYIRPLRGERFCDMETLLECRVDPSFFALCTVGLNLAQAFLPLHAKGYCYRDINGGNIAFDPERGDVQILDNDNVDVDKSQGVIAGTPLFMAPEVVRRETQPWSATDRHSLAVLLFLMFFVHHPFEGRRELQPQYQGAEGRLRLYSDPLYIFDPDDRSNEPDPEADRNAVVYWRVHPGWLKDLFCRSFTQGLRQPQARVSEGEWRRAMARLRDAIYLCRSCGRENFYDAAALAERGNAGQCWGCESALVLPPRLRVSDEVVVLRPGLSLYPHHVDPQREFDFGLPYARVDDSGAAIQNLSGKAWTVESRHGEHTTVPNGGSIEFDRCYRFSFDGVQGKLRA